jgi:hypothetical protein
VATTPNAFEQEEEEVFLRGFLLQQLVFVVF